MKVTRLAFLIFCIAVTATACAEADLESEPVEIVNPNPPAPDPEVIQFQASLESVFTKVSLPYRTFKSSWEKGDKVAVTDGKNTAVYEAFYGGSDHTVLVHSSGDTLALGASYQAWYPVSRSGGGVPSLQTLSGFDKAQEIPMTASSGSDELAFTNDCGLLRMNLSSQIGSMKLLSIVVKSSEPLSGEGTITLDCGKGVKLYNRGAQYAPVSLPEGTYRSMTITFNGVQLLTGSSGEEIEGESLSLTTAITEEVPIKRSEVTTMDVDILPPPVDLSEKGTANCYITEAAGLYKFKATRGCDSAPIDGIADVKVVWETMQTKAAIKPGTIINSAFFNSEDGYVNFITGTPYAVGNALIAALDASGNILWSWHIWLQTAGTLTDITLPGGAVFMNRDLGTATKSALLYQWGRKEPFVGSTSSSEKSGVSTSFWERENGLGSIADATANPLTAYIPSTSSEWSTDPDASRWVGEDGKKTIYDPCPAGYKVPFAADGVYSKEGMALADSWWAEYEGRGSYTKPTHTFTLPDGTLDVFTRTGTLKNLEFYPNPTDVYVWTASLSGAEGMSYMLSVREAGITLIQQSHYYIANVRCQKITE